MNYDIFLYGNLDTWKFFRETCDNSGTSCFLLMVGRDTVTWFLALALSYNCFFTLGLTTRSNDQSNHSWLLTVSVL